MRPPTLPGRVAAERLIDAGGFATVWLAWDPDLESSVAVKILADNWAHRSDVRDRFLAEGRLLRRVRSPHVVTVHDVGELEDGRPYLVMAYLPRGSLAGWLAEFPTGRPPAEQALALLRDVAAGLRALHAAGIVHRDLNPRNILLDEDGAVLADLGLAKDLAAGSGLTQPMGTGRYRAPEQEDYSAEIGTATDVYAFGVLADELLDPHSRRPWVTRALADARARDPGKRPSVNQLITALETDRVGRTGLRRRIAAGLGIAALVASGVTGYRWTTRPQLVWDAQHRVAVTTPHDWTAVGLPAGADGGGVRVESPDRQQSITVAWQASAAAPEAPTHDDCQQLGTTEVSSAQPGLKGQAVEWTCPNGVQRRELSLVGTRDGAALAVLISVVADESGPTTEQTLRQVRLG